MKMIEGTTKAMTNEGMKPLMFPSQEDAIEVIYTYEDGATYTGYADDLLDAADKVRLSQEADAQHPELNKHGTLVSVTLTF